MRPPPKAANQGAKRSRSSGYGEHLQRRVGVFARHERVCWTGSQLLRSLSRARGVRNAHGGRSRVAAGAPSPRWKAPPPAVGSGYPPVARSATSGRRLRAAGPPPGRRRAPGRGPTRAPRPARHRARSARNTASRSRCRGGRARRRRSRPVRSVRPPRRYRRRAGAARSTGRAPAAAAAPGSARGPATARAGTGRAMRCGDRAAVRRGRAPRRTRAAATA